MASQFVYESTHAIRDHEAYWHTKKLILKPSPSQLASDLAQLANFDHTTAVPSDASSIARYDAWRASLYILKQLGVRNELGLWDCDDQDDVDSLPSPIVYSDTITRQYLKENARVCFFVEGIEVLSPERQLALASEICKSQEEGIELCANFLLLGYLQNNLASCVVLHFAHIDHRSISIKILRSLFDVLKNAEIGKVIMSAASVVRRVIFTALTLEYKSIEFEYWSEDEVLFDWFGSRINNPMAVCRETACHHHMSGSQEACQKCRNNQQSVLGNLYCDKYALPFVLPQCMIARRFAMKEGDVLDSARPTGRFLRHYLPSSLDR